MVNSVNNFTLKTHHRSFCVGNCCFFLNFKFTAALILFSLYSSLISFICFSYKYLHTFSFLFNMSVASIKLSINNYSLLLLNSINTLLNCRKNMCIFVFEYVSNFCFYCNFLIIIIFILFYRKIKANIYNCKKGDFILNCRSIKILKFLIHFSNVKPNRYVYRNM